MRPPTKLRDGDIYFGHWSKGNNMREGKGLQITNKDDKMQVWTGWTFKKGTYGASLIIQKNGVGLFGYFNENNQQVGPGIKVFETGDVYEGEFQDGLRHGNGAYFQ